MVDRWRLRNVPYREHSSDMSLSKQRRVCVIVRRHGLVGVLRAVGNWRSSLKERDNVITTVPTFLRYLGKGG